MIYEYALDPALLTTAQAVRQYLALFDADPARVLAYCPHEWLSEVFARFPDGTAADQTERKHVTEALHKARLRVSPRRSVPRGNSTNWLDCAERDHAVHPFQGIITGANPQGADHVIVGDELVGHARWQVGRNREVPRTAAAMAEAVRPLLRYAKVVVLVDRYFNPENWRFKEPLFAFVNEVRQHNAGWPNVEITYHCGDDLPPAVFRTACTHLGARIPAGMRVHFRRWRGSELHARDLVTDRGGVNYEHGLDAASPGSPIQTVRVSLLDREFSDRLRLDFSASPPRYTPAPGSEVTVSGTQRT